MKFAENWKRFWTLNRRHAAGFTLVELIVVIAILAILAGVAVPAYSGYVTQANKQADISLAAEVADALLLYHYSHSGDNVSGYVVITPEGVDCKFDDALVGDKAMIAVFGEDWEKSLSLKYDGWIADNADGSSVVTNLPAETITSSVGSLTGLAGAASAANSNQTIQDVLTVFCSPNGQINTAMQAELEQYKDLDQDTYATIATNVMVKYLADEISADKVTWDSENNSFISGEEATPLSSGADYAMQYAMLYAMANSGDPYYSELANTQLTNFNTALENIVAAEQENSAVYDVTDALDAAFGELYMKPCKNAAGEDSAFMFVFQDYLAANSTEIDGITSALGALKQVAADYNDLETLSDASLFSGSAVTNAVAAYQLAAANGGVAIQISGGECTVMPKLS